MTAVLLLAACSNPEAEANSRFVAIAGELQGAAALTDPAAQFDAYTKADQEIGQLLKEYPGSEVAVKIAGGEKIGPFSAADLKSRLALLSSGPALCARAPTRTCVIAAGEAAMQAPGWPSTQEAAAGGYALAMLNGEPFTPYGSPNYTDAKEVRPFSIYLLSSGVLDYELMHAGMAAPPAPTASGWGMPDEEVLSTALQTLRLQGFAGGPAEFDRRRLVQLHDMLAQANLPLASLVETALSGDSTASSAVSGTSATRQPSNDDLLGQASTTTDPFGLAWDYIDAMRATDDAVLRGRFVSALATLEKRAGNADRDAIAALIPAAVVLRDQGAGKPFAEAMKGAILDNAAAPRSQRVVFVENYLPGLTGAEQVEVFLSWARPWLSDDNAGDAVVSQATSALLAAWADPKHPFKPTLDDVRSFWSGYTQLVSARNARDHARQLLEILYAVGASESDINAILPPSADTVDTVYASTANGDWNRVKALLPFIVQGSPDSSYLAGPARFVLLDIFRHKERLPPDALDQAVSFSPALVHDFAEETPPNVSPAEALAIVADRPALMNLPEEQRAGITSLRLALQCASADRQVLASAFAIASAADLPGLAYCLARILPVT